MGSFLFLIAGAALMLYMGWRSLRLRNRLRRDGATAAARVAGTGEDHDGRYYVLEIETEGGVHHLHYPMPRRGAVWPGGTILTLHYDPLDPKKLFVEGDRAAQMGMYYYFGLGAALVVLALLTLR